MRVSAEQLFEGAVGVTNYSGSSSSISDLNGEGSEGLRYTGPAVIIPATDKSWGIPGPWALEL